MKKIKRSYLIIIVIVVCVLLVSGMGIVYFGEKSSAVPTISQKVITIPEADRKEQTKIVLMQEASQVSGPGARIDGNKVTISKGGTYLVSGTLEEGQIYVEADKTDTVILLLQGAKIMNSSEAVIEVEKAGHVSIQLAQNTENELQSGKKVDVTEGEVDKEAKGAAVYARSDLSVTGEGSCKILGYINNAIQTKDNLVIDNGTLTIEACNNGIKGKDSVSVSGGTLSIKSGGDGIQADNATSEEFGNIAIAGGNFMIESSADALQAEYAVAISGGTFDVVTGGGSANVTYPAESGMGHFGRGNGDFGGKGGRPGADFAPGDKPQEFKSQKPEGSPSNVEGEEANWDMSDESETSRKGIKSGKSLSISGGTFSMDTYDDAFHSDGNIAISGGEFLIAAGDDGVHAETELAVTDGKLVITKSYEGMEGNQITMDGGEIKITSADDGMNAYGGQNSMGGGTTKKMDEMPNLRILDGTLSINAEGDGIDSNGNLEIEGGSIIVDGPINNGNGAIDSGSENGGSCTISGGTILALGSSGMAEGFSKESKQCSFMHNLTASYEKGAKITITDSSGKKLYQYTAKKTGSSVLFSSQELKEGEVYTLSVDGQKEEITMDSVAVTNGSGRRGWR